MLATKAFIGILLVLYVILKTFPQRRIYEFEKKRRKKGRKRNIFLDVDVRENEKAFNF